MRYLAENVNVIKSHDIFKSLHNKINVAITFDDGFENVYLNALPLLHRYSLPYTIFFVTDYLGKFPEWEYPDDHPDRKEKIMTKEQLISLNSEFGTIGSHTCSHRKLNGIDRNDLIYELKNSKLFLEQTAGREIDHLSFPNGAYDKIVLEESIKAGYKYIYTIDPENA
jgi:peptidoglycan/xylan/chitin deacetylase (PgdA/CDA1 family)